MQPDFSQKTIDILGKRAAYRCSNPDCRVLTIGPNHTENKSTTIGEAAHIHSARIGGARFSPDMSDAGRAEITNGIWLCRNCHKKVDANSGEYAAKILYRWREIHEKFIASEFAKPTFQIEFEREQSEAQKFAEFSPLIHRIAIDEPPGWEWRLTAELMRVLNAPEFRRWDDLQSNLFAKSGTTINESELLEWVHNCSDKCIKLLSPFEPLLAKLNASWGEIGEPGDKDEILHLCKLMRDGIKHVVDFEEEIYFTDVPQIGFELKQLFQGSVGSQIDKFRSLPIYLDEIVELAVTEHGGTKEEPLILRKTFDFELPDGWEQDVRSEIQKVERYLDPEHYPGKEAFEGFGALIKISFIIFILYMIFF